MKHNLFLKTIQSPDLANVNRLGIPDTLKGRGEKTYSSVLESS